MDNLDQATAHVFGLEKEIGVYLSTYLSQAA